MTATLVTIPKFIDGSTNELISSLSLNDITMDKFNEIYKNITDKYDHLVRNSTHRIYRNAYKFIWGTDTEGKNHETVKLNT
jgi:hypothetical protein